MNMEQLECFVAVVKYHTFSEAAEQLNSSQSSVSKKVISLEEELGIKLFSREKRQVTLTDAGNTLYQDACKILKLYENMKKTSKQFSCEEQNVLSISTLPILNQYGLMEKLAEFQTTHPEILLEINEIEEPEISEGISRGQISLSIARQEFLEELPECFEYSKITEDEFVLLASSNHPFAQRSYVSFEELKNEKFILMHKFTSVYTTFMKLCQEHQVKPQILRTARLETIASSVAIGQGISFMPLKSAELFQNHKTVICHFDKKITSTIVLAKCKNKKISKSENLLFREF